MSKTSFDAESSGRMPVTRAYDFEKRVPDIERVGEYVEQKDELKEIEAQLAGRTNAREPTAFLVYGETGTAKTTLAEFIAAKNEWPIFEIQGKYSMYETDILGHPDVAPDGSTRWVDGVLVKALLSSQERPTVIIFDEVNRARAEAKGAFFSALDYRCRVTLDGGRGGEVINGRPENLIVFATANRGKAYVGTQEFDKAELRRYSSVHELDYLGQVSIKKEASLIAERSPVSFPVAKKLVQATNLIRSEADNPENRDIESGIPTPAVINWANRAHEYHEAGLDAPAVRAARSTIIRPYYSHDERTEKSVAEEIEPKVRSLPIDADDDGVDDWVHDDGRLFRCTVCSFSVAVEHASDDVRDWQECPECGAPVEIKD